MSCIVHTFTCERDAPMAVECLGSVLRHVPEITELRVVDDGTLTDASAAALGELRSPQGAGVRVLRRADFEAEVRERTRDFPRAQAARQAHPLGRKLIDMPLLAGAEPVVRFVDSDIYFLRPVEGLFARSDRIFGMFEDAATYSGSLPQLRRAARVHGLRLPGGFNSALMQYPRELLALERVERILAWDCLHLFPSLVEQTVHGLSLGPGAERVLAPRQFPNDQWKVRWDDRTVAIHFLYRHKPRFREFLASLPASRPERPVAARFERLGELRFDQIVRWKLQRRWRG